MQCEFLHWPRLEIGWWVKWNGRVISYALFSAACVSFWLVYVFASVFLSGMGMTLTLDDLRGAFAMPKELISGFVLQYSVGWKPVYYGISFGIVFEIYRNDWEWEDGFICTSVRRSKLHDFLKWASSFLSVEKTVRGIGMLGRRWKMDQVPSTCKAIAEATSPRD